MTLLGGTSTNNAKKSPKYTDTSPIITENIVSALKDCAKLRAISVGITNSAPIRSPPTVFRPTNTVNAKRIKNKSCMYCGRLEYGLR